MFQDVVEAMCVCVGVFWDMLGFTKSGFSVSEL